MNKQVYKDKQEFIMNFYLSYTISGDFRPSKEELLWYVNKVDFKLVFSTIYWPKYIWIIVYKSGEQSGVSQAKWLRTEIIWNDYWHCNIMFMLKSHVFLNLFIFTLSCYHVSSWFFCSYLYGMLTPFLQILGYFYWITSSTKI